MSAPAIIAQLKAAGVRISRRGDSLLAEPRAAVTEPLLVLMRIHKGELLAALRDEPATPAVSSVAADHAPLGADRPLEPGELDELVALINQIADHHGFMPTQRAEAHQIAEADQVAALECFRSLAARDGLTTFRKANQIIDTVGSLHEQ